MRWLEMHASFQSPGTGCFARWSADLVGKYLAIHSTVTWKAGWKRRLREKQSRPPASRPFRYLGRDERGSLPPNVTQQFYCSVAGRVVVELSSRNESKQPNGEEMALIPKVEPKQEKKVVSARLDAE